MLNTVFFFFLFCGSRFIFEFLLRFVLSGEKQNVLVKHDMTQKLFPKGKNWQQNELWKNVNYLLFNEKYSAKWNGKEVKSLFQFEWRSFLSENALALEALILIYDFEETLPIRTLVDGMLVYLSIYDRESRLCSLVYFIKILIFIWRKQTT